jgi:hypothetical protein
VDFIPERRLAQHGPGFIEDQQGGRAIQRLLEASETPSNYSVEYTSINTRDECSI